MVSFAGWLLRKMGIEDSGRPSREATLSSSMGLPPVWYAFNKIVGDCGMLPLNVKMKTGERSVQDDLLHDGYYLFHEQPNPNQAPSVFKEQVTGHAIMYGNGRAAIIRDERTRRITELIPMMPERTDTVLFDGKKYHVTAPFFDKEKDLLQQFEANPEGVLVFKDEEVLHISGFTWDGVEGVGLMQIAKSFFNTAVGSQDYLENLTRKGFRGGKLFIETPLGMFKNESEAAQFMKQFNDKESGAANAGKAAMLRDGMKANAISMTNSDAQFVELQKFTRQDVGMLFGLENMPGDKESSSYNSLEQHNLGYLRCLDRWLVKWEEQCDIKLRTLPQKQRKSHYFQFNREAIYRTDLSTKVDAYTKLIINRVMSPNEVRQEFDLNPYEGGDVYENPAISVPSNDAPQPQTDERTTALLEHNVRLLIRREMNDCRNGANKANFCGWIDQYYAKWESKLADKLEGLGLDRNLATLHCNESKEALLNVAGDSTPDELKQNVDNCVSAWEGRFTKLLGENEYASV